VLGLAQELFPIDLPTDADFVDVDELLEPLASVVDRMRSQEQQFPLRT
jgi:hypothetical protein